MEKLDLKPVSYQVSITCRHDIPNYVQSDSISDVVKKMYSGILSVVGNMNVFYFTGMVRDTPFYKKAKNGKARSKTS